MLIKVEAINIDGFVHEAQNLNAIRGGGLMLLKAPEGFKKWLDGLDGVAQPVKTLTQGASKAVFQVATARSPGDLEDAANRWLRGEFPHATIAVAVLPNDDADFFTADAELTTRIRAKQIRSFTVAGLAEPEGTDVCKWDHVRPAARKIGDHKSPFVSEATAARYEYGRNMKKSFLHEGLGLSVDWEYTWEMQELAGRPGHPLDSKVALFYCDGNRITSQLRQALKAVEQRKQADLIASFDKEFQGKRDQFRKQLLERTSDPRWQNEGARRIEVLLWGGDEMMLVVPAWCGWEVAELFCGVMKDAAIRIGGKTTPIKHAMALIFAHQKAPIHALTDLAHDLAEESKKDRDRSRLSYLVLESFDHVGEELEWFLEKRWPDPAVRKAMVLDAEGETGALKQMDAALGQLKKDEFPRRKVFQAALGWRKARLRIS